MLRGRQFIFHEEQCYLMKDSLIMMNIFSVFFSYNKVRRTVSQ